MHSRKREVWERLIREGTNRDSVAAGMNNLGELSPPYYNNDTSKPRFLRTLSL